MFTQARQGPVEVEELLGLRADGKSFLVVERPRVHSHAPLATQARPRAIDENLAHGAGRNRQQVAAVPEAQVRVVNQFEIGLVHEAGGIQAPRGQTTAALPSRQPTHLVVDQGDELAEGSRVAFLVRAQKPSDVC